MRRAARTACGLALHQFLLRHRQAEAGEDLVGLFLVAGELDGDCGVRPVTVAWMRCWYLPWPSCTSDWSFRRSQGMPRASAARTSDAVEGPSARRCAKRMNSSRASAQAPTLGYAARGAQLLGQQRAEQAQAELAGGDAFVALRVLVDDRVHPGRARAARLAEGDRFAGDVLQLDRHVLEHVAEPGALALAHAAEEAARLAVRAAVLGEPGQRVSQRCPRRAGPAAR